MKKLALMVAMVAMALVAAAPALAQESAAVGPGGPDYTDDLGLESITIASATIDPKTKELTVSGTVTCSEPLEVFVDASVRQDVGRLHTVQGYGGTQVACEGQTAFSFTVSAFEGRFGGGNATVSAFASAYDDDEFGFDFVESGPTDVKIKPSH